MRGPRDFLLRFALCVALCATLLPAAVLGVATRPGHAQSAGEPGVPMVVAEGLARAGLRDATNIRQRGPNFTANAINSAGAPVKVVIQASNGAIIGYRVLAPVEVRP